MCVLIDWWTLKKSKSLKQNKFMREDIAMMKDRFELVLSGLEISNGEEW